MSTQAISATDHSDPNPSSREELERAERRARHLWVTVIVGLLSLQVAIGVTSIFLAVGDPSVAIIPHYHQAALDWDTTQRARHLTEKLGWQIKPNVSPVVDGQRQVQVQVLDRNGEPVSGLHLSAKAYHHARGAEIYEMRMTETEAGTYAATTSLIARGLWDLKLQLEGDHGIASDQRDITVR
jgi:nitrogen fixation protein FixH